MNLGEIRVLIIDDVNAVRVQFKSLLKSCGFEHIYMCESAEEAIKAIERETYHLVVCDWHMAPMDGLQLLKHLRSHPVYKAIPFVMVTAESTRDQVLLAIQSGVDDYVLKPLTLLKVDEKIRGLLVKKGVVDAT